MDNATMDLGHGTRQLAPTDPVGTRVCSEQGDWYGELCGRWRELVWVNWDRLDQPITERATNVWVKLD